MKTRKQRQAKASKKSLSNQPLLPKSEVSETQDDPTCLPFEVTVDENVEPSSDSPVLQSDQLVTVNVVSPFEDDVTLNPEEAIPKFLSFDSITNKFVFFLSKYDFDDVIAKHNMNDKKFVKSLTSIDFLQATSKMMTSFYQPLTSYYQTGFSSKFKRNFCAVLASKLPYCEKKFQRIKQKSAKGKLSADLSKTVKSLVSYSDFLYYRFDVNSRHSIKQAAKNRNQILKVKKNNGPSVAARNRIRKSLMDINSENFS